MKICPTCRRTYTDDGLNFCLDDGAILTFANADLPETVMMQQPMPTQPAAKVPTTSPTSPFGNPQTQQSWDTPQFSMQPQAKKSRTWLWLLGIAALGLLLCGGGAALFIGLAVYNAPEDGNNVLNTPTPRGGTPGPGSSPSPLGPNADVRRVDLSSWVNTSQFGTTSFSGGEFVMSSKQKDYYYVLCATDEFKSENATVRVNLRNIGDASTSLGYGLVFHSNPTPLQQGYAFLIDTKKGKYKLVRHEPGKEVTVVPWTNSSAIKPGTETNQLEVRHKNDMNELFINGKTVTSVKNTFGYQGGVVGLYTGDGIKIGFKDLEIAK
jgi:hypothetical protein